jgi:hypothetical protein
MNALQPNLPKLNGYYYAYREARFGLWYGDEKILKKPQRIPSSEGVNTAMQKRIDEYILLKFAEKYPELKKHIVQMKR